MSVPKLFTKTQQRILTERLEYYYLLELKNYEHFKDHVLFRQKKTLAESVDRKHRLRLKSMEIVLHNLGSKLFENVAKPSLRQSKQLTYWCPPDSSRKRLPARKRYWNETP